MMTILCRRLVLGLLEYGYCNSSSIGHEVTFRGCDLARISRRGGRCRLQRFHITVQFTLYSTINYPVRHLLRTHFYFSPAPGSWTLSTGRRRLDVDAEAAGQMITKQGARYTSTILW
jgi:hypothetical protein